MKKKTLLIILSAIASLTIISCKRKLTDEKRAENAVQLYLDSIYKDDNVEITKFTDFKPAKYFIEQEKKWADQRDTLFLKSHPDISEKGRIQLKKEADDYYADEINRHKGKRITCYYKVNNFKKQNEFWIEPDLKTVHMVIIIE